MNGKSMKNLRRRIFLTGATATALCLAPIDVRAGVLDTQSHPVQGDFAATDNWTNAANWNALPRYPADPAGDGSPADGYDWFFTQVAHSNDYFFIRYHNSHQFAGDRQLMYFDTDSNPATGLPGFTGNLAVGAEFYLSGAGLNDGNTQIFLDFIGWNNQQDGSGEWDIMISIDRNRVDLMPGVTSFNFVNQNHDQAGDDWYPDAGNSGGGGDFFRYEATQPTLQAFGRTWNVFEPAHRDNPQVLADMTGGANELALTGVFGTTGPLWDTRALVPLTVDVGTKVSYHFALTHEMRDPIGNGLEAWVADAFGAFTNSGTDPSNANLATTRVGVVPHDDEATEIQFNGIGAGEEGSVSLLDPTGTFVEHHLADGVHIEWLFTSETTVEISVYSADGMELLGPTFVDTISNVSDIQGFRFNIFDSEQTLTISDFTVEQGGLPGDFNSDGVVDGDDLNDPVSGWKARFGAGLDGNDFLVWQRNLGASQAAAATGAVSEPATTLLALLGIVGAMSSQRRSVADK